MIAAILGAIAAACVSYIVDRVRQKRLNDARLVAEFLYPLQDDLNSLRLRLHNIAERGGRAVMDKEYFLETTTFLLVSPIAHQLRLRNAGMYAALRQPFRSRSRQQLLNLQNALTRNIPDQSAAHHYHWALLAESCFDEAGQVSYRSFAMRINEELLLHARQRIYAVVDKLDRYRASELMANVSEVLSLIAAETRIERMSDSNPDETQ